MDSHEAARDLFNGIVAVADALKIVDERAGLLGISAEKAAESVEYDKGAARFAFRSVPSAAFAFTEAQFASNGTVWTDLDYVVQLACDLADFVESLPSFPVETISDDQLRPALGAAA